MIIHWRFSLGSNTTRFPEPSNWFPEVDIQILGSPGVDALRASWLVCFLADTAHSSTHTTSRRQTSWNFDSALKKRSPYRGPLFPSGVSLKRARLVFNGGICILCPKDAPILGLLTICWQISDIRERLTSCPWVMFGASPRARTLGLVDSDCQRMSTWEI